MKLTHKRYSIEVEAEGPAILLLSLPLIFILGLLALSLWLSGCGGPAAATGPGSSAAAVTGDWAAAWPDSVSPAGLVSMSLAAGGAYQVTIDAGGKPLERERGAWLLANARVVFSPATCEAAPAEGEALALVACGGPDSIAVDLHGSTWPVAYKAGGQLLNLIFRRL